MKRLALLAILFCGSLFAGSPTQFLAISDIHYGSLNDGESGHDTGPQLLDLANKKFSELSDKAGFILLLGDIPTHMSGINPVKTEYEKTVFHSLFQSNLTHKPLFYITGNNDSLQGNYQIFQKDGLSPLTNAEDWQGACVYCDGLLIDVSAMQDEGYYSSYVMPDNNKVVLIALNSIIFTRGPISLPPYENQREAAARQLQWLQKQLATLSAGQLLIAMHVPPGIDTMDPFGRSYWHDEYQQAFIDLLNQYQDRFGQITLVSSHTHMDEIRKINLDNQKTIYTFSSPSISRDHKNNSSMKLFKLNEDYKLSDFITYYTTTNTVWGNDAYQAIQGKNSILPECQGQILSQCLDKLSVEQICTRWEQELIYGVKNPQVINGVCNRYYLVN